MEENKIPELTLDPLGEIPAAPVTDPAAAPAVPAEAPKLDDSMLSDA